MSASLATRILVGAGAGLAGTAGLDVLRTMSARWWPETAAPIRKEPGTYMIEQVEGVLPPEVRSRLPGDLENLGSRALALGYGITASLAFALARRRSVQIHTDGILFGIAVWAVGYLGWMPKLRLMPPVTRQTPAQVMGPLVQHVLFGMMVTGVIRAARRRWE
jgi:hypothetical protein